MDRFLTIILLLTAGLCFNSTSLLAQSDISDPEIPDEIEIAIDNIFSNFNDNNKPGAAVAVAKGDSIIFSKGYGSANLEYGLPVSPSTVFHIASVSKQFTVFAVLLLEQEGKLSFDDDIRKHIPEVPDFGTKITLRHLAAHTSGMRDQWDLLNLAGWRMDDVITKDHILNLVSHQKELNFNPGEEYLYCNTGFTLLAEVVARVSGESFSTFTENRIFRPLNMNQTLFFDDHERIVKNRAYSYKMQDDKYKKSRLNFANAGATSLFTTVEDLALWSMNFKDPKVGNSAIVDKMNTLAVLNNGETFEGAYGQFVVSHKGHNLIQHGGADAGYRSYLGRFPDEELAVMVFSNFANSNPRRLAMSVADLYLDDRSEPKPAREERTFVELSPDHLKQFEGQFWNESNSLARKIYVKNDTLRYFRSEGNETALVPLSFNKFEMKDVSIYVTVEFKKANNALTMYVEQENGHNFNFESLEPIDLETFDLKQYAGIYFSEELMTEYELYVQDGKLMGRHFRLGSVPLKVIKEDYLESPGGKVTVTRNKSGRVNGLKVTTGRVRNLNFEKK